MRTRDENSETRGRNSKNLTRKFSDVFFLAHGKLMTRLGGHVTIFSQVPAQTLDEFRVNSVHGGAWVSSFLFRAVALGLSKYKYAVRRAPLNLKTVSMPSSISLRF